VKDAGVLDEAVVTFVVKAVMPFSFGGVTLLQRPAALQLPAVPPP